MTHQTRGEVDCELWDGDLTSDSDDDLEKKSDNVWAGWDRDCQ